MKKALLLASICAAFAGNAFAADAAADSAPIDATLNGNKLEFQVSYTNTDANAIDLTAGGNLHHEGKSVGKCAFEPNRMEAGATATLAIKCEVDAKVKSGAKLHLVVDQVTYATVNVK